MEDWKVLTSRNIEEKLNDLTYSDYYYRLMLIARSIFKWNNLPNGIDEKWIEQYLYGLGECIFFEDDTKGFMVAKCNMSGNLNYYDEPTSLTPYGTDYTGEPLENGKKCVLIRNNDIMLPTAPTIQLFAYRLMNITRTSDVNVEAQQTPLIVLGTDKQMNSLKRFVGKVRSHALTIFGYKDLDVNEVKSLNTQAPIVFDKLRLEKHEIWNECMTFLGINNANMNKRERLVDDEVQANNEQIDCAFNVMFKSRQLACEQINKMFDLNISVEKRAIEYMTFEEFEKAGDKNVCTE